jgi:CRISPR-associated protein Csy2
MKFLLIKNIKISNANAMSSPYTIGFPAMTGWLGAMHALQRHLNDVGYVDLKFKSVGIACHELDLQSVYEDYNYSIVNTLNPLNKDGSNSSIIAEPRCHLDVSLVITCEYDKECELLLNKIYSIIKSKLRIAGGTIDSIGSIRLYEQEEEKSLLDELMPAWVIIERRELMYDAMTSNGMQEGTDALNAIFEYLIETDNQHSKAHGWIVPITTGFYGISELAYAKNQRDPSVKHRFAESIVTLGEFKLPCQIKSLDEMMWSYNNIEDLYICTIHKKGETI